MTEPSTDAMGCMDNPRVNDENSAAYRRLKATIDKLHPPGWFVAITSNQVLATANSFRSLESELRTKGIDPRNVLVVQAGVDCPENVTIFI